MSDPLQPYQSQAASDLIDPQSIVNQQLTPIHYPKINLHLGSNHNDSKQLIMQSIDVPQPNQRTLVTDSALTHRKLIEI